MNNKTIFIVIKRITYGDIETSFVVFAFNIYRNALLYIDAMPDKAKFNISYDVEEIEIGDNIK